MDINATSQKSALAVRDIGVMNRTLGGAAPESIVEWIARRARRPVISTNFRPLSAALLDIVARRIPGIPVIWVDSGFNTEATQGFARQLTSALGLNLKIYTPKPNEFSGASSLPAIGTEAHARFTRAVKLEPFERALAEWRPDYWITGIRADQTAYRRSLETISTGPSQTIRVAPFLRWTEVDVEGYIYDRGLPDYDDYFDPTKGSDDRECGLQTLN